MGEPRGEGEEEGRKRGRKRNLLHFTGDGLFMIAEGTSELLFKRWRTALLGGLSL